MTSPIMLTSAERLVLTRRARRGARPADARRARVILLLADGMSWSEIAQRLECSRGFIATWCKRFTELRTAGLEGRHIGQVARVLTPALETRILKCKDRPRRGGIRWTSRSLAEHLHISHMTVMRVWREHGEQHRRIGHDAPAGAVELLALYLDPSAHAAVFGVVGNTVVKTRGGKGRTERAGNGGFSFALWSLYDACTTKLGAARENSPDPHSAGLQPFLTDIVVSQPGSSELHLIADNLSQDENKQALEFLGAQQKVRLHLMPTYSSWLKQVEMWISRLTPDPTFRRKLMHQIRLHNGSRQTLRWIRRGKDR